MLLGDCYDNGDDVADDDEDETGNDEYDGDNPMMKMVMLNTMMAMTMKKLLHLFRPCSWGMIIVTMLLMMKMVMKNTMIKKMMKKLLHLLRPCSGGTLDEATLQHGSPTVHNLYVLQIDGS